MKLRTAASKGFETPGSAGVTKRAKKITPIPMTPKNKEHPAMTSSAIRAQLRRRMAKTPVTTTKPPQAKKKSSAPAAKGRISVGMAGAFAGKVTRENTKSESSMDTATNAPPIMATTPAATTEAGARGDVSMSLLIAGYGRRREGNRSETGLDISL